MSQLRYSVSISLDGFVAGPDQGPRNPLGRGGERLHEWMRELRVWRREAGLRGGVTNASSKVVNAGDGDIGAVLMGRNMFGGGPGPWGTPPWGGWWGRNPPFHRPVFVVTHHERPPLVCEGGTTFHFITGGVLPAVRAARRSAGRKDVAISGGAGLAKQCLSAGLVDEVLLHVVPVFLGDGVRLFEDRDLARLRIEQREVIPAPGVTHLRLRVRRGRGRTRPAG